MFATNFFFSTSILPYELVKSWKQLVNVLILIYVGYTAKNIKYGIVNKVIPLSMTDKSLVVGMVNPNDKKVLNEIVYQTGLKPTIVLVTHVEFENFLNKYI